MEETGVLASPPQTARAGAEQSVQGLKEKRLSWRALSSPLWAVSLAQVRARRGLCSGQWV